MQDRDSMQFKAAILDQQDTVRQIQDEVDLRPSSELELFFEHPIRFLQSLRFVGGACRTLCLGLRLGNFAGRGGTREQQQDEGDGRTDH
jgi:hypothetical protein